MHLFSHETMKMFIESRNWVRKMKFRYAHFCQVPAIRPSQLDGVGEIFVRMGGGPECLLLQDILPFGGGIRQMHLGPQKLLGTPESCSTG